MNIILWILQALLALAFLGHAYGMLFPVASQTRQMPYIMAIPTPFRRTLGITEALGAVGLILPPLTHIWPWLIPWAATGLVIQMAAAAVFHIRRREYVNIGLNLFLLVLAAFVAYGRFVIAPL
jgi:putative oxidoreductase